jgi:hypothetical protein
MTPAAMTTSVIGRSVGFLPDTDMGPAAGDDAGRHALFHTSKTCPGGQAPGAPGEAACDGTKGAGEHAGVLTNRVNQSGVRCAAQQSAFLIGSGPFDGYCLQ